MARGIKYKEIADENVGEALGINGFDITMTTEAADMAQSTGKRSKYALLWQQVGRPKDKTFASSEINQAAVPKKTKLRHETGPYKGKPIWYETIPAGGRPASVDPKYKCPVCGKAFAEESVELSNNAVTPGAMMLDTHVRLRHPGTYPRWRPMLRKLMATVTSDPTMLFAHEDDPDVAIVRDTDAIIDPDDEKE
jgi:hypothetical protein